MIPAIIAALVVLAGGTTVVVADDATPGDALYGVDRATERVRLVLASDEREDELRLRFAEERLDELEEVIEEESDDSDDSDDGGDSAEGLTEAEAKVFTNDTVVKVELNDMKQILVDENTSTERTDIVMFVAESLGLETDVVDAVLTIEVKNRASTEEDKQVKRIKDKVRVETALENATVSLAEVAAKLDEKGNEEANEAVQAVLDRLMLRIETLPDEVKTRVEYEVHDDGEETLRLKVDEGGNTQPIEIKRRIDEDGEYRYEWRGEGVRTRIDVDEDGEVEIEVRPDNRGKGNNNPDDDEGEEREDPIDDDKQGLTEAEIRIGETTTSAEVEFNDQDFDLTFETTDIEVVKARIAAEFGTTVAEVEAVLKLEDSDDDMDDADDVDEDADDESEESDTDDESELRIEARVQDGKTDVHVKNGDEEDEYTSTAASRGALIMELASKYSLTTSAVDEALDYEVEESKDDDEPDSDEDDPSEDSLDDSDDVDDVDDDE